MSDAAPACCPTCGGHLHLGQCKGDSAAYPFRNVVSSTNQTLMVDMRPILVGRKP